MLYTFLHVDYTRFNILTKKWNVAWLPTDDDDNVTYKFYANYYRVANLAGLSSGLLSPPYFALK